MMRCADCSMVEAAAAGSFECRRLYLPRPEYAEQSQDNWLPFADGVGCDLAQCLLDNGAGPVLEKAKQEMDCS